MKNKTLFLTKTAVIATLYVTLTLAVLPFAYGPIQFRLSEVLTILPLFYVEAIAGLYIGCLIANIASGMLIDIFLGSFATLISAILTYYCRKIYFGVIPPIVVNALIVPIIFLTIPEIETGYFVNVLSIGLSQTVVICGLGIPFYFLLRNSIKRFEVLRPTALLNQKKA